MRIAADARFSKTNFADDQIWELNLSGGDPDAAAISTSYGRRTQPLRLFQAYLLGGEMVTSTQMYHERPGITACFPNYIQTRGFPFISVEALTEYWAPESHLLASRTCLINHSEAALDLKLILFAAHPAGPAGRGLSQQRVEGVNVLTGEAGNIQPLIFMNGGAVFPDAVFPGLQVSARLQPGEFRYWTWVHAGLDQVQQSFRAARSFVYENWDAQIARLEMLNAGFLRVETGEPEWDLAFYLSQRTALASMMSPTHFLPHASYVKGRLPDCGYSSEGRGRDYAEGWSGQQIQETGLLLSNLVYAAPEMAEGLLLNFLHRQRLDGFAEGQPGLAGGRSDHRCPPLLAALVWELYEHTRNREFLKTAHEGILALFNSWFTIEQDRDEDGFPEWDSILHAEFEHWKPFVRWYSWGSAMEVSGAETVDLLSFLLREVTSLQLILEEIGDQEMRAVLDHRREDLLEKLDSVWLEEEGFFSHRDRDSHEMAGPELLGEGRGAFTLHLDRRFEHSHRVLVRVWGDESRSDDLEVHIHGRGQRGRGRIEKIKRSDFCWFRDFGSATSEKTYRYIEKIEVHGISKKFRTEIVIPGTRFCDSGSFLPLWAVADDSQRMKQLVMDHLLRPDRFWLPGGIPECPIDLQEDDLQDEPGCGQVSIVRNARIGEGLLQHGFEDEAAGLVVKLMSAITKTLGEDQGFRSWYNPNNLSGSGVLDDVQGLVPLRLFMKTIGLHLHSPYAFTVEGENPFPWPVTIGWRGLTIRREKDLTGVVFPDGQVLQLEGPEKRIVELPRPENR